MGNAKWIDGVSPDQPISKVAGPAIDLRLKVVSHYLRLAAKKAHKDDHYVHQLRVSTRRADSALRMFRDVLPDKKRRWMSQRLKRIRRVAGEARDLDVLCDRLRREVEQQPTGTALEGIIRSLERQRVRVQPPLVRIWKKCKKDDFDRRARELVKRVKYRGKGQEPRYHELAVDTIQPLVNGFFQAGEEDLVVPEKLHDLRIAGKRLRYGLELLAAGLDPSLRRDVYPEFAEIQETLGDINDHVVAKGIFECWLVQANDSQTTSEIARVIGHERDEYRISRHQFDEWWTPETVARLKARFSRAIASNAPTISIQAFPA